MRFDQTGVGCPHDTLKLPELAEETRVAVVDLFGVLLELRMFVLLNIPEAVGDGAAFCASNLLLLETPVGELDLVREQSAASHEMDQSELCLDGANAFLGDSAFRHVLDNLDLEKVVGITLETLVSVCRDLVLPIGIGHGRAHIVGVDAAVGGDVIQADDGAIDQEAWVNVVPCRRSFDLFAIYAEWLSLVLDDPNVVFVLVRVESDLLLVAAGRVHVAVRVQVAALSVVVAQRDTASESHIGGDVLHALAVEGRLELGGHETITVTRVDETEEVNGEHGHVECDGNDDEAEDAGEKVLEPEALEEEEC